MQRSSIWPLLAATAGLVVLTVILLTAPTPKAVPRIPGAGTGEIIEGEILSVLEQGTRDRGGGRTEPFARFEIRVEGGSINGAILPVDEIAIGGLNQIREFHPGDRVLLSYTRQPDGTDSAFIVEYVRRPQLAWLAAIFAVAIGVIGGFQGLRSLLGMAVSFVIILRFIIPHILAGQNPVLIAVSGALLVMVATLYLSHGFSAKTNAALAGTVVALVLTGVLGQVFIEWTRLTGLASEEASYLSIQAGGAINLQGLLLGGLIISTLGVLDDVAISQASAVFELHAVDRRQGVRQLFRRGMRIGRDHIAATVNTLFLAYAGASLPLLLLLSTRPEPLAKLVNREYIAVEIVGALVGSIGLVAAVPLTTAGAAVTARWLAARRPPSAPDPATGGPPPRPRRSRATAAGSAPAHVTSTNQPRRDTQGGEPAEPDRRDVDQRPAAWGADEAQPGTDPPPPSLDHPGRE